MSLLTERATLNPSTEDPTLAPIDLIGTDPSWGIYLLEQDYSPPELQTQTAGTSDTEGDPVVQSKYGNRTISYRVRIVEPPDPASTNLATNPVAFSGVTGWGGVSLAAGPTRVTPATVPLGKGIDSAVEAKTDAIGDYVYQEVGVTNGVTYRFSIYCQLQAKVGALALQAVVYNAAGAAKKATGAVKVENVDVTQEGWVRLDVSFVADATATWRVGVEQTAGTSSTFAVTGVLVEASATLTPFFCGDTPGCDFTGARHASTSTRPAPDGTRFSRIYRDLTNQLDRIKRTKSGTLRRLAPGFKPITFDLRTAKITDAPQDIGMARKRAEIGLSFEADPGGRTPEAQVGVVHEEGALPCLIFLAEEIPGDLAALGRLQVEEKQAKNQLAVWWGEQRDTYSSDVNAGLFYEAEGRSPLGAAVTAELSGASGAGKNAIFLTLANAFQAVFSTQATGGGAHLSHTGTYRVIVRVTRGPAAGLGTMTLKWQWAVGDFGIVTVNEADQANFAAGVSLWPTWSVVDLGSVTIPQAPSGTAQRWEGRLLAKSTHPGDQIYADWLLLLPTESSGLVRVLPNLAAPGSYSVQDSFDQAAGTLTGKAPAIGAGTYTLAGDAVGFTVSGSGYIERSEKSDAAGVGAYGIAGTTELTNVAFQLLVNGTSAEAWGTTGGFVRYVDTNNHVKVVVRRNLGVSTAEFSAILIKKKAGVESVLGTIYVGTVSRFGAAPTVIPIVWITANGEWRFGINGAFSLSGTDADFGEAGTLKTGKVGVYDELTTAESSFRGLDKLEAWAPAPNAAMFASRQLEIRSNQVRRQDSAGVTWGEPPYKGDYLSVLPAGPEKKPTRFVIKGSRDPENDAGIDDIAARLFVQSRYLVAPPA